MLLGGLLWLFIASAMAQDGGKPWVLSGPTASPVPAFADDTLRFDVSARDSLQSALTYTWNFGDGSDPVGPDSVATARHRFAAGGHYAVTVRVKNAVGAVTGSLVVGVNTRPTPGRPVSSSTIILDSARGHLWCVNTDNGSVSELDLAKQSLLREVPTGARPQTLALAPDGSVWVANQEASTISILDGADGHALKTLELGYGARPFGIAFSPDGQAGYATLEGPGKLIRLDPIGRNVSATLAVGPYARGLAISQDGKRILITRFLSPPDEGQIYDVDAPSFTRTRTISLPKELTPDGETSGSGVPNYIVSVVISPDGKTASVPCVKADTDRGLRRSGLDLTKENTVRAAMYYIDLQANTEDTATRTDFDNSSLPVTAVYSPLGDLIFVALENSNAVHLLDPFNHGAILERNKLAGSTPKGLALDAAAKKLYVHNFLDRAVSVFDVSGPLAAADFHSRILDTIPTVTHEALTDQQLQGKRVFYNAADTRMSLDGYISCSICHLDGGTDGRVWDFSGRGEGLRRTTNMLGRAGMGMGPVHWSANFDEIQDFENDIRGPFQGTGFMSDADFNTGTRNKTLGDKKAGLSPELDALAAYVSSLTRVHASPYRNADGTQTDDAKAGELLFNSAAAGCARCHLPPLYTDSRLPDTAAPMPAAASLPEGDFLTPQGFLVHDVGTLKPTSGHRQNDTLLGLDTPTLKGVWENTVNLHDGSAATLLDVITTANPLDKHGHTSQLSQREKEQLVAFLQQLDDGPEPVGLRAFQAPPAPAGLRLERVGALVRVVWTGKAQARLALLDTRGRMLREFGPAANVGYGLRGWLWNGRAADNRNLPPGVYRLAVKTQEGWVARALPWIP